MWRVKGWHESRNAVVMSGFKKGRYVFNGDGEAGEWKV